MKYYSYTYTILFAFLLSSCESFLGKKEKIPLEGQREAILLSKNGYMPNINLQTLKIILEKAEVNDSWPMASGNSRHAMPPLKLNPSFKLVWDRSIGQGSTTDHRLLNGPIVVGNYVYTIDSLGILSAFELSNGEKAWETSCIPLNIATQPFGGGLAYDQGKIYVATANAEILALDAKNGHIIWRFATSAPIRSAPTVSDGRVFVVTINNQLEVFNANDGQLLWTHTGMVESAGLLGGASPAVHSGVVVVPYSSGEVFALRIENGYPLWSETLQANKQLDSVSALSHIKARPIIDKNLVFLVSHSGRFCALDMRSGQTVWTRDIGGIRTPAVSGSYIFMITNDNQLLCLTKDSGQIVWAKKLDSLLNINKPDNKFMWAGPIIVNDTILVTSSNRTGFILSSQDGGMIKRFKIPGSGKLTLSPIVANQILLVLLDSGMLTAFR